MEALVIDKDAESLIRILVVDAGASPVEAVRNAAERLGRMVEGAKVIDFLGLISASGEMTEFATQHREKARTLDHDAVEGMFIDDVARAADSVVSQLAEVKHARDDA